MSCILHGVFEAAGRYLRGTVYTYMYAGRDRIVHVLVKKIKKQNLDGETGCCCPAGYSKFFSWLSARSSSSFEQGREKIVFLFELYPNLTVQECLEYMGDLAGDPKTERYYFPTM